MELARKWAKMGGGVDSELFDGLVWERERASLVLIPKDTLEGQSL